MFVLIFFIYFFTQAKCFDHKIWGHFKPYLIYSISEKHLYPITLRFGFSYRNTSLPTHYDLNENQPTDLIINYEYNDGKTFSQQKIYDKSTNFQFKIVTFFANPNKDQEEWESFFISDGKNFPLKRVLFKSSSNMLNSDTFFGFSLGLEQYIYNLTKENTNDFYIQKSQDFNNTFLVKNKSNDANVYVFEIYLLHNNEIHNNQFEYEFVGRPNKYDNWKVGEDLKNFLNLTYDKISENTNNTALIFRIPINKSNNFLVSLKLRKFNDYTKPKIPTSNEIFNRIEIEKKKFNENYLNIFRNEGSSKYLECSISSFSNLLGGFLYTYGPIKTSSSPDVYRNYRSMFTLTPCRRGFARSFLWDDGFHNMILAQYDPEKSLEILINWFETVEDDGWIPREQIRGKEVEEYANKDFIVQLEDEANPPTLMIPLKYLFDRFKIEENLDSIRKIREVYPKIKKWFYWFHTSQRSGQEKFLYRWKPSKDGKSYLGSGMDDYPRDDENFTSLYHLDLQVWNIMFAELIIPLSVEFEADPQEIEKFHEIYNESLKKLHQVLKDPKDMIYKDSDGTSFSNHFGYDNLFPLAFGLISEESDELENILKGIRDEQKLWSLAGLRSLSKSDSDFKKNSDYWTSPIWVNLNYLVLRGLKKFYLKNEFARKIYNDLRENLMDNICSKWRKTGYFWETFDEETFEGTHHFLFNGWTSLITLIISEKYI